MKLLFIKFILFLLPLLILLGAIEYETSQIPNSYNLKKNCVEKNLDKLELLILGNSQPYYDINPTIISRNSCNLANSNQDFYYDNKLLEMYLSRLNNLKTVIIPISYFSFSTRLEDGDEYWRKYFYSYFLNIEPLKKDYDLKNYSLIALYTPKTTRGFILHGFKVNLVDNVTENGWFQAIKDLSKSSNNGVIRAHLHTKSMNQNIINFNQQILESTILKLRQRNIQVVLITTPASSNYYQNIDKDYYQKMQESVNAVSRKFNLYYLNYFKDQRFNEKSFADSSDHLTKNAAQQFSQILKNDLKNILNTR